MMFKKARKHSSNSDVADEDSHRSKHTKHAGRAHDKHLTDKMAQSENLSDGRGYSARHSARPLEDSDSDEILIKHRASKKSHSKPHRDALPRRSPSGQDLYLHYVPVYSKSPSPPLSGSHMTPTSSAELLAHQKAVKAEVRALRKSKSNSTDDVEKKLKHLAVSSMEQRHHEQQRGHKKSLRSKHEKLGKHGKKKDHFLAPLTDRWVCYSCGKVRSDKIQDRHPLGNGQKMQPNWCGQCRVANEMNGIHLSWEGQRHYCWGCGIVRSTKYHQLNPVADDDMSDPNYCRPCREASPSFEGNLRAVSEFGSEVSVRNKAFERQIRDAELSDVEEDDEESDKENRKPAKTAQRTKSSSSMPKDRDPKIKAHSDKVVEGGAIIHKLKAMHLEADRKRNSMDGGARLSDDSVSCRPGSYRPPSCESTLSSDSKDVAKPRCSSSDNVDVDHQMSDTPACDGHRAMATPGQSAKSSQDKHVVVPNSVNKACQTDMPETINQQINTGSSKKVHWPADHDMPKSSDPRKRYDSDSGFSSDASMKSTGSYRRRPRDPAEFSTGSPPERYDSSDGDIGQKTPSTPGLPPMSSSMLSNGNGIHRAQTPWVNMVPATQADQSSGRSGGSFAEGSTDYSMPPTPPYQNEAKQGCGGYADHCENHHACSRPWVNPTRTPQQSARNFSKPMSPNGKYRADTSHHDIDSSGFATGYGTRHDYLRQSRHHFGDAGWGNGFYNHEYHDEDSPESMGHMRSSCAGPSSSPFNFSTFGKSNTMDDFYSHKPNEEDVRERMRTFVSTSNLNSTPRWKPEWQMYDDGDLDEAERLKQEQAATSYNSTSTRTNSGSYAHQNVTILSIDEITDEDELALLNGRSQGIDCTNYLDKDGSSAAWGPSNSAAEAGHSSWDSVPSNTNTGWTY